MLYMPMLNIGVKGGKVTLRQKLYLVVSQPRLKSLTARGNKFSLHDVKRDIASYKNTIYTEFLAKRRLLQ